MWHNLTFLIHVSSLELTPGQSMWLLQATWLMSGWDGALKGCSLCKDGQAHACQCLSLFYTRPWHLEARAGHKLFQRLPQISPEFHFEIEV